MRTKFSVKTYLPLILVLVVAVACFLIFVFPTGYKIITTYGEVNSLKQKIDSMSKKSQALEKLDKADLVNKAEKLNYYLPSSKDVSVLLNTVSELTSQTGLTFNSLSLAPGDISTQSASVSTVDLPALEVSLSLTGSLENFLNFLKKAEKASPIIRIENLKVSKKAGTFDFDTIVTTYFKPLPKSLGAASEGLKQISPEDEAFINSLPTPPVVSSGQVEFSGSKTDPFSK